MFPLMQHRMESENYRGFVDSRAGEGELDSVEVELVVPGAGPHLRPGRAQPEVQRARHLGETKRTEGKQK